MKPLSAKAVAEGVAHPLVVPHAALAPDPNQPRQSGVEQGLDKLIESVRAHGVIQPILVRPHPDPAARARTPYMIVVGERRWTAAGRAGRDEVPVFLLDQPLSPGELLMLQLEENDGENRQELTLRDLVGAVARAFQLEGLSQAEFALRHGHSVAWVSYRLALHRAEGLVAEALRENRLRGMLVARTFQRLDPEQQQELLARARKHDTAISLVATEKLAGRAERSPRGAARADRDVTAAAPPATPGAAAPAPAAPKTSLAAPAPAAQDDSLGAPAPAPPGASLEAPTPPPASLAVSAAAVTPEAPVPSHAALAALAFPGATAAPGPTAPVSPTRPTHSPAASSKTAPHGTTRTSRDSADLASSAREPAALEPAAPGASMAAAATAGAAASPGTPATASAPTAAPEPIRDAPPETASSLNTPSGSPSPAVLRYRGATAPSREPAPLPGAAARAPLLDRSQPAGSAPASPAPAVAAAPLIAPRSAAAGLLAAAGPLHRAHHAGDDPLDPDHPADAADPATADIAGARITIDLSLAQLQKLVRLLGLEPAATPRALVHQLMTSL